MNPNVNEQSQTIETFEPGVYKHSASGNEYILYSIARHSEKASIEEGKGIGSYSNDWYIFGQAKFQVPAIFTPHNTFIAIKYYDLLESVVIEDEKPLQPRYVKVGDIDQSSVMELPKQQIEGMTKEIKPGHYKHYKGDPYEVLSLCLDLNDPNNIYVLYIAAYDSQKWGLKNQAWLRPLAFFTEEKFYFQGEFTDTDLSKINIQNINVKI